MVVRKPNENIGEILVRIRDFIGKEKVTLRVMQQLFGDLNCRDIARGSLFCRCLILTQYVACLNLILVNSGMMHDLDMWLQFVM